MVTNKSLLTEHIWRFHDLIRDRYPVQKILLYGSHAKGRATEESDIDVAVVVDLPDHSSRIAITADLFYYARQIDSLIEPKRVFWDEYQRPEKASILSEIIATAVEVV